MGDPVALSLTVNFMKIFWWWLASRRPETGLPWVSWTVLPPVEASRSMMLNSAPLHGHLAEQLDGQDGGLGADESLVGGGGGGELEFVEAGLLGALGELEAEERAGLVAGDGGEGLLGEDDAGGGDVGGGVESETESGADAAAADVADADDDVGIADGGAEEDGDGELELVAGEGLEGVEEMEGGARELDAAATEEVVGELDGLVGLDRRRLAGLVGEGVDAGDGDGGDGESALVLEELAVHRVRLLHCVFDPGRKGRGVPGQPSRDVEGVAEVGSGVVGGDGGGESLGELGGVQLELECRRELLCEVEILRCRLRRTQRLVHQNLGCNRLFAVSFGTLSEQPRLGEKMYASTNGCGLPSKPTSGLICARVRLARQASNLSSPL